MVGDEIGYLPLERQAANLLFALVASRYERGSIIVTSNRSFEAWGEIFGDQMVAAALIDRLVHQGAIRGSRLAVELEKTFEGEWVACMGDLRPEDSGPGKAALKTGHWRGGRIPGAAESADRG